MYRNWMKYVFEENHLNNSVYYSMHYWTRGRFLITVNLLVWMMHMLIHSVYPMQKVMLWNVITKKAQSSKLNLFCQDTVLVSFTAPPPNRNTAIHTGEKISSPSLSKRKGFSTKLRSWFGVTYRKIRDVGMKQRALKIKYWVHFGHLQNVVKDFQK